MFAVPDRAFPQRDHRRGAVRAVRGDQLLVAQGDRLPARDQMGQALVLAVGVGLLVRFRAALRARADGRDAAAAAFRRYELADLFRDRGRRRTADRGRRSEEHKSELQSLMRISYAVFCLKKKNKY